MAVPNRSLSRMALAVVGAVAVSWLGALVLGEYPFEEGTFAWLPILGGFGLGAAIAWVVTRAAGEAPPIWLGALAGLLALWGEARAVDEAVGVGGDWPMEGWLALVLAGGVASYNTLVAPRRRDR